MSDQLRLGTTRGWGVVLASTLASGMAFLDGTVVNVALPHIGAGLHADLAGLQWTVNAYTLALASLVLLGGALGDRYGRRRVFLVGVAWFSLASVACGLAPNIGVLVSARAVQGVGPRCSPRVPGRCSSRPLWTATGAGRSVPGRVCPAWRPRSGRSWAGG